MNIDDFNKIKREIKTTCYARYFSSKRLLKLHKLSLLALTTASTSLIIVALTSKYLCGTLTSSNIAELLQLVGSIVVLIISIIITFADYPLKSERMRNSADKISRIHKKLRLISFSPDTTEKISELYEEYAEAVVGENHSQWDYINGRRERILQEREQASPGDTTLQLYKLAWNNKIEIALVLLVAVFIVATIMAANICLS